MQLPIIKKKYKFTVSITIFIQKKLAINKMKNFKMIQSKDNLVQYLVDYKFHYGNKI